MSCIVSNTSQICSPFDTMKSSLKRFALNNIKVEMPVGTSQVKVSRLGGVEC